MLFKFAVVVPEIMFADRITNRDRQTDNQTCSSHYSVNVAK